MIRELTYARLGASRCDCFPESSDSSSSAHTVKIEYLGNSNMYGGGPGSAGYGADPEPGPSHYASPTVGYQLALPPPPPPPPVCPATGSQLLSYGSDLSPHHIQQTHTTEAQQPKRRR